MIKVISLNYIYGFIMGFWGFGEQYVTLDAAFRSVTYCSPKPQNPKSVKVVANAYCFKLMVSFRTNHQAFAATRSLAALLRQAAEGRSC